MNSTINSTNTDTIKNSIPNNPIEYPMPEHEYANCKVCYDIKYSRNGFIHYVYLKSYSTTVCGVIMACLDDTCKFYRFINGLYSRTTIKHIGWFTRFIDKTTSYYGYKELLQGNGIEEISEEEYTIVYRHFH